MSVALAGLGGVDVVNARTTDVGRNRRAYRRRRLATVAAVAAIAGLLLGSVVAAANTYPAAASAIGAFLSNNFASLLSGVFFVLVIVVLIIAVAGPGKSPHEVITPDQISVRLDDVVGIDVVKEDVVRSLNLFLSHETYAKATGGKPRRGLLFEGPPGTGKTYTAKAVAKEAGVPFLLASATSFQSSFYGATAKKIRSYFKELRRLAEQNGGAIGFIDEFDAIGGARRGMEFSSMPADLAKSVSCCSGTASLPSSYAMPATAVNNLGTADLAGPVVNELLVQLQSFDSVSRRRKAMGALVTRINRLLPEKMALVNPATRVPNIMIIASTNRADGLDPALMRPGRFDRKLTFETPDRAGRRALIDHFLARKAHTAELDNPETRDAFAALTSGYSPAMLEHIFDEGLVGAVRRGDSAMNWADVQEARLIEEVGLGQPIGYTDHEKALIATHEAGHCTAAWLLAPHRRLDILTIIKRRNALGLLAHSDREDVFTQSKSEMTALIRIAMGGQCAEQLFFDDVSTGPAGDLLYATNVAAQMIGAAGMGDSLVSYAAVQNSAFNDSNLVGRVLADSAGREAVERMLHEQRDFVTELLAANQHLVAALRDALLERSELLGTEITDVLEAAAAAKPAHIPGRDAAQRVIDLRESTDTLER